MKPSQSVGGLSDLQPGDHLCCLYETPDEHREVLTLFLRHGLERGEKAVYITDAYPVGAVLDDLRNAGVAVDHFLSRRQLQVLTPQDAGAQPEGWEITRMIAILRAATARALEEGFGALRITYDMTWALPPEGNVIEYELKLYEFSAGSRCLSMCQFDRRRFAPAMLLDVLRTHPIALIGSEVYENCHSVPARELLSGDTAGATLRHWLKQLCERKKVEGELTRERSLFRTLLENMPDHVFIKDAQGRKIITNAADLRDTGARLEDVIGRTDFDLFPRPLAEQYAADDQAVMQSGTPLLNRVEPLIDHDGKERWLLTSKVPLRDESGVVVGLMGISRDITEYRRAEQILTERTLQLEAIRAVTAEITRELNLTTLLDLIARRAAGLVGVDRCAVMLWGEDAQTLNLKAWHGSWEWIEGLRHPLGEAIKRLRPRTAESRGTGGVWESSRAYTPAVDQAVSSSVMAEPLVYRDRLVGIIALHNDESGSSFSARSREILSLLADQATIAIENARLHEAAMQEIAERRKAEAALEESRTRYRDLVETVHDWIWECDISGRYTYVSPRVTEVLGYTPEEVLGRSAFALRPPDEAERVAGIFQSLVAQRKPGISVENVCTHKNGRRVVMETSGKPFFSDDGTLLGYRGVDRNITERKQAEAALEESRARYRDLVETIEDWIWEVDAIGAYTYVSPRVNEALGYTPQELLGRTPFDLMPPEEAERVTGIFRGFVERREPIVSLENICLHKNGRRVVMETGGKPFFGDDGTLLGYRGVDRNITERRRLEEERELLVRNLQEALASVRTLKGLLPICASCKRVRDDEGYWIQVERYLTQYTEAQFSHGLCPECTRRLYPELSDGK